MKRTRDAAFTLIELLLVMAIIGILMAMLIPTVRDAIVVVKKVQTENRVAVLDQAVRAYRQDYGSLPPCFWGDQMSPSNSSSYPPYPVPDMDVTDSQYESMVYLFNDRTFGSEDHLPFGGKFLAYFLMGPNGAGWHRPMSSSPDDPNARNEHLTAEWDVPSSLDSFIKNDRIGYDPTLPSTSDYMLRGHSKAHPCFVDAFGFRGQWGGLIGYVPADPRALSQGTSRFQLETIEGPYAAATFKWTQPAGDGKGTDHFVKQVGRFEGDFVIISPGEDGRFGYQSYGKLVGNRWYKSYYGDMEEGHTDDIANGPLVR